MKPFFSVNRRVTPPPIRALECAVVDVGSSRSSSVHAFDNLPLSQAVRPVRRSHTPPVHQHTHTRTHTHTHAHAHTLCSCQGQPRRCRGCSKRNMPGSPFEVFEDRLHCFPWTPASTKYHGGRINGSSGGQSAAATRRQETQPCMENGRVNQIPV